MDSPLVSVLLTSFNHESFIAEAITSVLNQSFTDFELIIWDDASTDHSWKIIQTFQDPRIRSIRNATNGCARGLNEVLMATQAEFIAIHHSDDDWEPDKLAEQVKVLRQSPELGACFTHVTAIDQNGEPIRDPDAHYTAVFKQPNRSRHAWLRHFFFLGNALCHPSVLIRKQCFVELGTYNEGLYQLADYHMWIRLCMHYEIEIIPKPLTRFRVNTEPNQSRTALSMSAPSMDATIRTHHEAQHALEPFYSITLSDLLKAFPEAESFLGTPAKDSVVPYMLAMVALTSENGTPWPRPFAANLLSRCWMNDEVREKLYSIHGLTRHQLRNPDLLVDHANYLQINQLITQLREAQSLSSRDRPISNPPTTLQRLLQEIQSSESSSLLKQVQQSIPERSFHLYNHILYDIRTTLGDRTCTYLEIGSYCGASALLMLAHPLPTHVICVDPLNLPPSHFNGSKPQDQTLYDNLLQLGKNDDFEIIKSGSQDQALIEALYQHDVSIDILFIDGDHCYAAVIADFLMYEPLVKPGGFIVFDDYCDNVHSPDVRHAVDAIVAKLSKDSRFDIVGLVPDLQHCSTDDVQSNEFVIYKRELA